MKKIYLLIFLLLLPLGMTAQSLRGSYFMENSLMRHKLNPAFTPSVGYFSMPALGNLGLGVQSNVGTSNFLFPKEGTLYTYLNEKVSFEEFDSKLPRHPYLNLDVDIDVLDFGFQVGKHSYMNFQVGMNVDCQVQLARELFTFAKLGMGDTGSEYRLKDFNIYQNSNLYAALGYNYDFSHLVPGLRAGLRGRFLVGADHVAMKMQESRISMSQDEWRAQTDATANVASTFLKLDASNGVDNMQVMTDFSKIAPAGYGFSADLGIEYRLEVGSVVDGLAFSIAALDLGAIWYDVKNVQTFRSAGEAAFSGFDGITLDNYDFDAKMQEITDQFMDLANLEEVPTEEKLVVSAQPKLLVGVEMPFVHDMMSVGVLYSNKFAFSRNIQELTLSYNLTPTNWFNFGLNYSMLNTTRSFGWLIEFIARNGVNFFLGSDYTFLEFTPQFLPVNQFCLNARLGLSFTFGGKKDR